MFFMKFRYYYFVLFFFLQLNLFSQSHNPPTETQQIALVSKILQNSSSETMHKVWPHFDMRAKPIFITFGNGHIYAFNITPKQGDWKKTNFNGAEIFYTDKDLWGITTSPMQFNFLFDSQEAFIFRLDMMPEPLFLPFFVMVHERFHVYQIENFASEKSEEVNTYPESENAENLALMQLEELVLLDFLQALTKDNHQEAITQLKTFISVHKKRCHLLSPSSIRWEARQQMVEGLADYAGAKNLDVFSYFGEKTGQMHILHTMKSYIEDDDITARVLKWRHYGVGASLAYALDLLQVADWKNEIELNVSLQTLLEKNLKVSESQSAILFQQASQKYNFPQLSQDVHKRIQDYQQRLKTCAEEFKNLPGIVVNIQNPPKSGVSAGGHSKALYSLIDGSMLSVQDTSKNSSSDSCWNLELRNVPYVYNTNDGFRRFKESYENLEVMIDGKKCSLADLEDAPFQQLTLKGRVSSFHSIDNPGRITLSQGELKIMFKLDSDISQSEG